MNRITCRTHSDFSVAAVKKNSTLILLHLSFSHFANDDPKEIFSAEKIA